jgi:hypothetical protein
MAMGHDRADVAKEYYPDIKDLETFASQVIKLVNMEDAKWNRISRVQMNEDFITKQQLKQIIKEELKIVLDEKHT